MQNFVWIAAVLGIALKRPCPGINAINPGHHISRSLRIAHPAICLRRVFEQAIGQNCSQLVIRPRRSHPIDIAYDLVRQPSLKHLHSNFKTQEGFILSSGLTTPALIMGQNVASKLSL